MNILQSFIRFVYQPTKEMAYVRTLNLTVGTIVCATLGSAVLGVFPDIFFPPALENNYAFFGLGETATNILISFFSEIIGLVILVFFSQLFFRALFGVETTLKDNAIVQIWLGILLGSLSLLYAVVLKIVLYQFALTDNFLNFLDVLLGTGVLVYFLCMGVAAYRAFTSASATQIVTVIVFSVIALVLTVVLFAMLVSFIWSSIPIGAVNA